MNLLKQILAPMDRKYNLHNDIPHTVETLLTYYLKNRRTGIIQAVKDGYNTKGDSIQQLTKKDIDRIITAYGKAKDNQVSQPEVYQVGRQWQSSIEDNMSGLTSALRYRNKSAVMEYLLQYQRARHGESWGGYGDTVNMGKQPFSKYEYANTYLEEMKLLRYYFGEDVEVNHPQIGNPFGVKTPAGVIPIEALRYKLIAGQINNLVYMDNPVRATIAEIGGGQGGQAFQVIEGAKNLLTYILFDIPEILVLASASLLAAYPKKTIQLYGETMSGMADISLMPHFTIKELPKDSVDLVFNQRSFVEMKKAQVDEYMQQVGRICKRYLYHINYDVVNTGHYTSEEIPTPPNFDLILKTPFVFSRAVHKLRFIQTAYLYERRYI